MDPEHTSPPPPYYITICIFWKAVGPNQMSQLVRPVTLSTLNPRLQCFLCSARSLVSSSRAHRLAGHRGDCSTVGLNFQEPFSDPLCSLSSWETGSGCWIFGSLLPRVILGCVRTYSNSTESFTHLFVSLFIHLANTFFVHLLWFRYILLRFLYKVRERGKLGLNQNVLRQCLK